MSTRKKSLIQAQKKYSQVAKAAVLSSAMLNSSGRGTTHFGARDSIAVMAADMLSTQHHKQVKPAYVESETVETALKAACCLSLATVCLHTPKTLQLLPGLPYIILFLDFLALLIFTTDVLLRVKYEGKPRWGFLRDRWCQFDVFILCIHWISWGLHVYQITSILFPAFRLIYREWFGVIRSVRPFIIVKLIRLVVKFKLPKNRIEQLLKRSSQQVKNVTVFFVFFMVFYAIMGIQLFGRMDYHCVLPQTDPKNVTINDLAIPDTMCSQKGGGGYECPGAMVCMRLNLNAKAEGFYGMFNHFAASAFTVYLAASEEGWVYVLYDCMDSLPSHLAFAYFLTLIFFLAWLVKNVFIAVITETFAEIRVQFSEMWTKKEVVLDEQLKQKLERTEDGWRLIRLDDEKTGDGRMYKLQQILRSNYFQGVIIMFVILNAAINASYVHYHDASDAPRRRRLYIIEIAFTILFNIECLVKIICYGWIPFIKRGIFKFELILCLGSSLNVVHYLYERNYFTYFQVFRLIRLIKASPMLEDFVWKIFSPGKKLGGLVIFTITFVIIASAISLQLFSSSLPNLPYFQTFPQAFVSMFQIITQEGWTDFVVEVLRATDEHMVPFVAIYFVAYHLFVTLIVLSLFVAVILDNLEMDEELKKVKQLKAREATTSMRTTLPWRLRVFEKFPSRPQMASMRRADSDFPLPKVRDSFTHQFAFEPDPTDLMDETEVPENRHLLRVAPHRTRNAPQKFRHVGSVSLRSSVAQLLDISERMRQSLCNSLSFLPHFTRSSGSLHPRKDALPKSRVMTGKFMQSALRTKQSLLLGENGDLRGGGDSAPKKELKQGEIDIRALQQKRQLAEITRNRIEEDMRENHPFFDRPLFLVGRVSRIRDFCQKVVHAKYDADDENTNGKTGRRRFKEIRTLIGIMPYLDWAMVTITILSCGSMLFESPWPTTGENLVMNNYYLQIADYVFVLAMTFELMVKVTANGLFFTPKAVVKDVGGFMTLFIYFTSVVFLAWLPKTIEINSLAQLLMIFRAMRPLRIYTLVPHIRRVVLEFFRGFKEILLVTILMIVVMFIFASFAVQSFGGKLAACNDPSIKTRDNCTGLFWQKLFVTRLDVVGKDDDQLHPKILVPRTWTNPRNFHFDDVGNAMLALFETLSYKGWNVIRDILWTRQGPWAVVFIHLFVFIGCMIGLTLFVGVVVMSYAKNRGTALLTVDQRRWHDLRARLKMAQPLHVPPKPPESARIRNYLYELTLGKRFDQLFNCLVVLNSATLVFPWNQEEENERGRELMAVTALSALINVCFAVEIILKVIACTFAGFWQSKRNRLDLLITVFGLIWVLLHFPVGLPSVIRQTFLRRFTYTFGYIIVVLRFFTIASRNNTLKMLMMTVVMSMFRSSFIITAMFLLVLFYAYTGVILFGMLKYGQAVSKHVNFRTGSEALVVLFRSITGEDWNDIMHDAMRSAPFCYWEYGMNYWETDCGNYYGAIIYFCSFYLIITYIVRNLLVAIIMENFSLFYSSEEDALLSYADIRNFQLVWNVVDVEQKGSIPVGRVKFLLRLLKGRLEVDPDKDRILFKHMCWEMERLHSGEDVTFHDVLYMLSYRSVDIRKSLQLEELLQREELEYSIEEEVAKQTIRTWLEGCLRRMRNPTLHDSMSDVSKLSSTLHIEPADVPKLRFGAQEDTESAEEIEETTPLRKRNRRNSIPEAFSMNTASIFHEAAKKLIQGSSGSGSEKHRETVQLLPKRTDPKKPNNQKALHLNVYDLPDVEERSEDTFSPPFKDLSPKVLTSPIPRFSSSMDGDVTAWWSTLSN